MKSIKEKQMKSSKFAAVVTAIFLLIGLQSNGNAEETSATATPSEVTGSPSQQPFTFFVKAPGKTQNQLYSISRDWFMNTFNNVGGEITNDDRKSTFLGQVVTVAMPCDGMFDCFRLKSNSVFYKLRIDAKDGEVKMTYLNPVRTMYSNNGGRPIEFTIKDGLDLRSFNKGIVDWGKDLETVANAKLSAENSLPEASTAGQANDSLLAKTADFQKGKTTLEEAKKLLGEPVQSMGMPEDSSRIDYAEQHPERGQSVSLILIFDKTNRLKEKLVFKW